MASMMERSRAAAKKRKQREDEEKKKKEKKALSPATRKQPESRRTEIEYPKGNRAGKQGALGRTKATKTAAASTATTVNRRKRSDTSKGELDKAVRDSATATSRSVRGVQGEPKLRRRGAGTKTADYDAAFNKEFAAARRKLGPGGVFTYEGPGPRKGKKFTTDRGDDKPAGGFSKVRGVGDIRKTIPGKEAAKPPSAAAVKKEWKAPKKGFLSGFVDKVKSATTRTGKPNRSMFQRGARMTPAERRKYDAALRRWETKSTSKKAGGRVGKPAKKAASRRSSVGMKAGGRVGKAAKTAARTSVKKKFPRRP